MSSYFWGMMSGELQVISRDENLLSEEHGSLALLWLRPNIVELLRGPTAKILISTLVAYCPVDDRNDDFMCKLLKNVSDIFLETTSYTAYEAIFLVQKTDFSLKKILAVT